MYWLPSLLWVLVPCSLVGWLVWLQVKRSLPGDPEYRYREARDALGRASRGPRVLP